MKNNNNKQFDEKDNSLIRGYLMLIALFLFLIILFSSNSKGHTIHNSLSGRGLICDEKIITTDSTETYKRDIYKINNTIFITYNKNTGKTIRYNYKK